MVLFFHLVCDELGSDHSTLTKKKLNELEINVSEGTRQVAASQIKDSQAATEGHKLLE